MYVCSQNWLPRSVLRRSSLLGLFLPMMVPKIESGEAVLKLGLAGVRNAPPDPVPAGRRVNERWTRVVATAIRLPGRIIQLDERQYRCRCLSTWAFANQSPW